VRTFVSLDTESGIIRRYSENAKPTHIAGLTSDPDDADRTLELIEGFRQAPHYSFGCVSEDSSYEAAVAKQIRDRKQREQLLIVDHSHRDEA
jgi:hypothetical protein